MAAGRIVAVLNEVTCSYFVYEIGNFSAEI